MKTSWLQHVHMYIIIYSALSLLLFLMHHNIIHTVHSIDSMLQISQRIVLFRFKVTIFLKLFSIPFMTAWQNLVTTGLTFGTINNIQYIMYYNYAAYMVSFFAFQISPLTIMYKMYFYANITCNLIFIAKAFNLMGSQAMHG